MKRVIILVVLLAVVQTASSQDINLMTYNIRYDNPKDGINSWPNRKEFLLSQLEYLKPEIFGTQEGLQHQIEYLDSSLSDYSYIGIGRDENSEGEYCALFYNAEKFELINEGTFWLSETPTVPSRGWDASLNRICTYGQFEIKKSETQFLVFNTHFDHRGVNARARSAELIIAKIKELNSEDIPVMLLGDFNLKPEEEPIQLLSRKLNDSRIVSVSEPFGPTGTFCGFDISKPTKERIDYIFTSQKNVIVNKYAVIANVDSMRYPSDHLPVLINITFLEK